MTDYERRGEAKYLGRIGGFYRSFEQSLCCQSTTERDMVQTDDEDDRSSYSVYTCEQCGNQYTTEDIWWYEGDSRRSAFWSWRLDPQ